MNPIEKFYRNKEILGYIKKWNMPLNVSINEDREKVEIGFYSEISSKITKTEKINLLKIIMCNMEKSLDSSTINGINPRIALIEELENELKELKENIKKDLNLK